MGLRGIFSWGKKLTLPEIPNELQYVNYRPRKSKKWLEDDLPSLFGSLRVFWGKLAVRFRDGSLSFIAPIKRAVSESLVLVVNLFLFKGSKNTYIYIYIYTYIYIHVNCI